MPNSCSDHFSVSVRNEGVKDSNSLEDNEFAILNKRLAELEQEVNSLKQENQTLKSKVEELMASHDETARERDLYHYVLTHIPGGILIMLGPDHVFSFTNPAYLQIANRDSSIMGRTLHQVFPEIESSGLFDRMDEVYNTGKPFVANELPVPIDVTGKGDIVEIYYDFIYYPIKDKNGNIIGVFDFATDVTERLKSRQILEHERHRLREIFEDAPASIAVLNGPDHVYELANNLYLELIGRDDSIIGRPVAEVVPEAKEQGFIEILEKVYRTNTPYVGKEILFLADRKGTGELDEIYVNFVYQPMLSIDGSRVESIFAHVVDITEQVQSRRQVEKLSHLKDEFLAVASHDLRTPVTSIKGYVQLLHRNLLKQLRALETNNPGDLNITAEDRLEFKNFLDANLKIVSTVLTQTNRINELIARFLDYSRITQDQIKLNLTLNADLIKLVSAVVENLSITTTDHQVLFENSSNLSTQSHLTFDEARLEQVLNNLVGNAIKYSPPGTTIKVGINQPQPDDSEIIAWVKDEGFGISPEEQTRLFQRFYRIQNDQNINKGGLGLGLYISAQIIKEHGGRIWVESKVGEGSTFYIALPLNRK